MVRALRPGILALACGVSACGGGAATLYPAHTLAQNQVTAGAGVSNNFAFDVGARTTTVVPPTAGTGTDPEQIFFEDQIRRALMTPGLAPWVGARVGIGGHNEAGLTYTGRTARLDARHAFVSDSVALSIGLGASGVLVHPGSYPPPEPGTTVDVGRFTDQQSKLSAAGWGLELPVIAGWRSSGSVVSVWGGARAGFERLGGGMVVPDPRPLPNPDDPPRPPLQADLVGSRLWAGGLLGFAIGVKPIWIAVELDAAYQAMWAGAAFPAETQSPIDPAERKATFSGVTVAPTGAIIGKFW
jgi:hypothetical protein